MNLIRFSGEEVSCRSPQPEDICSRFMHIHTHALHENASCTLRITTSTILFIAVYCDTLLMINRRGFEMNFLFEFFSDFWVKYGRAELNGSIFFFQLSVKKIFWIFQISLLVDFFWYILKHHRKCTTFNFFPMGCVEYFLW